jgi:hypothetical protein
LKSVSFAIDPALDAGELEDVIWMLVEPDGGDVKDWKPPYFTESLAFPGLFVVRSWGTNWGRTVARHRQADTRYLELHRGKWRATVAVPRPLHTQLGSRLKRPLNTTSLATANALKWAVVAELRAIIDKAARGNPKADQPADEALTIAAHRAALRDPEAVAQLDEAVADQAEEMRGDPVAVEADDEGRPVYVYDTECQ